MSAGESGYGAGEHAFARIAAQRYIRAQKTRSKCRRRSNGAYTIHTSRLLSFPSRKSNFKRKEQSRIFLDYLLFSTVLATFFFSLCVRFHGFWLNIIPVKLWVRIRTTLISGPLDWYLSAGTSGTRNLHNRERFPAKKDEQEKWTNTSDLMHNLRAEEDW